MMTTPDGDKQLYLMGVSFRTAPAAVREALRFSPAEARALLQAAAREAPDREAVILSTCNRTEFYLAATRDAAAHWIDHVRAVRPQTSILDRKDSHYRLQHLDAARHLFRVACGLDSAILGDRHILSQIKEARAVAVECGTVGKGLYRLFDRAMKAGKRAHHETAIGAGSASIGAALVSILARHDRMLPQHRPCRILILGAGEVARSIGRHLAKERLGRLVFLNRTMEHAGDLAREYGGAVEPWPELPRALMDADIIIAATAAPQPVLRREWLETLSDRRGSPPPLVIDAGLPRNVETGSSLRVIDIDAIQEQQEEILAQRQAAFPAVERIIEQELTRWKQWCATRPVEEMIKTLYEDVTLHNREAADQIRGNETISHDQAAYVFSRSIRRALDPHIRRLRQFARTRMV